MYAKTHELDVTELEAVAGGMIWTPGHKSPNVVDARGGMVTFLGMTITVDINHHISSVTHQ